MRLGKEVGLRDLEMPRELGITNLENTDCTGLHQGKEMASGLHHRDGVWSFARAEQGTGSL